MLLGWLKIRMKLTNFSWGNHKNEELQEHNLLPKTAHTRHTSDTPQFCAAPWPSIQKVGHVITWDHWSRDHLIGDPWFAINRFWNFSDISIGDRVTPLFCVAPWPSFQKAGHVTTRDLLSRDHPIGDPHLLLVAFGIFQISLSVFKLLPKSVS